MSLDVGTPVRFKMKRNYMKSKGKNKYTEHSGRIKDIQNGLAIIEGVDLPGLYNRPLAEICIDHTLFGFVEKS